MLVNSSKNFVSKNYQSIVNRLEYKIGLLLSTGI